MADRAVLLMGDMLFADLSALPIEAPVFMREDIGLCTRTRHHKKKIVLFLAAMRHFAQGLGDRVHYESLSEGDFSASLARFLSERGIRELHTFEPNDRFFARQLAETCGGVRLVLHDSPGFLTSGADWTSWRAAGRRLHMADFYRWQRRRLGVLIEGEGPAGGKWSFDSENRERVPRHLVPPAVWPEEPDAITREVMALVEERFPDHPGSALGFGYAVTHEAARERLSEFVETRLPLFGPYEDAISLEHTWLWHSVLTPYLNCGLLTPREVVRAVLARYDRGDVEIRSVEGFIRQVIGWREFIRGIDREYESAPANRNPFGHARRLGEAWWNAQTGLPPLDGAIRRALDYGWCHHIERLMVIGAAMLMAEIQPEETYRWFMEMFVDSADWVMGPNVYGMSQFADGGLFATKPYLSGSAYLLRMSDYPRGPWCEVWDGLYWRFVAKHREFFASNPRTKPMVLGLDGLEPARRDRIVRAAEGWIEQVTV